MFKPAMRVSGDAVGGPTLGICLQHYGALHEIHIAFWMLSGKTPPRMTQVSLAPSSVLFLVLWHYSKSCRVLEARGIEVVPDCLAHLYAYTLPCLEKGILRLLLSDNVRYCTQN